MSFTTHLEDRGIRQRYEKVRRFFHLRESAYDVTSKCQLRCHGCYYFSGDKYRVRDETSSQVWREFLRQEKERGINFVNLAGAEPSLRPEILRTAYETIPLGCVFTNGLRKVPDDIRYRIHVSVWGNNDSDSRNRPYASGRPGPRFLDIQLANYADDDRVVFIYTFNAGNIEDVHEVIDRVARAGRQVAFNVYSAPVGESVALDFRSTLEAIRVKMIECMEQRPADVIACPYGIGIHTNESSLFQQFGCPYPRASGRSGIGIGSSFRSYRADLTHNMAEDCCIPDTDCSQCRHYAAGSAIVTANLRRHVVSEHMFRSWLDYVDAYLATWVLGYARDLPLLASGA